MRILLSIKAVLNYLYNHLIDLVWTKKIRFADGTEMTTVPTGNNLYDIKLLSQAVADKGFVFMCHTTRRDLPKADVPTLYNDILNKLNNSEKQLQPMTQSSLNGRRVLYSSTLNKWFFTTQKSIFITENLVSSTMIKQDCNPNEMICGDNIFICYLNDWSSDHPKYYMVIDLQTNETKYFKLNDNGLPLSSGAVRSIVKDGYIYVCPINRSNFRKIYKFSDSFSISNYQTITFEKNIYDIQYDNGFWYVLLADGVYKGTDINNPSSFTRIYQDDIYSSSFLIVKNNFSCYLKGRIYRIVYTYDLYANTEQTLNNYDILYASAIPSYPKLLNNTLWTNNSELKMMSIDINNFNAIIESYHDVTGLDIGNDTVVYGCNDYLYFTGLVNKQYTDTYIINGNSVPINYYKYQDFKICLADGGTNDTNLETVFNYLGYLNYWLIDLTNETVCIQRDKNTYSAMFIGDDFIDDLNDLPTNDYSCVALKKYVDTLISQVGAVGITPYAISSLSTGTKNTVYGKTQKPTLVIFGEVPPAWEDDWNFYLKVSTDNNTWIDVAYWRVGSGDPSSSPMYNAIIGKGLYWKFTTSHGSYTLKYAPLY